MSARILVVDDNPINVKLLKAKLSKDYYVVLEATNGEQALEISKKELPDLILLDVMMPEMDGFEVCTKLKEDQNTKHIPVIMVTALSDVQDRVRGLKSGADDFITKPINDIALFARVRSLLRLKMIMDEWRMREETAAQFSLTPPQDQQDFDKKKGNVLLLESDDHDQKVIIDSLSEEEITIESATNIDDVILKTSDNKFDLVMISLNIGVDNGLSLCAKLRSQEATRTLPILMIAHEEEIEHVARSLDLGANDYLIRPIGKSELKARTHTQIRQKHHYDRLRDTYEQNMAMALVDPLTGSYNRRYLDMHLPMLWGRCQTTKRPLSVLSIDLDHFKAVNDTYGHAAGDAVLKETISRVLINVRPSDLVVRMGGEEFSIIMPETDYKTALSVGERLREVISSTPMALPDKKEIDITASFGVSTIKHDTDNNAIELLNRSDEALYKAKETGRNKVIGEEDL